MKVYLIIEIIPIRFLIQAAAAVKDGGEYEVDEDAIDDAVVAEPVACAASSGNN